MLLEKQIEAEREFEFTDRDFTRIRTLIYEYAGIALSPQKQAMVYSRVARRLRANGLERFGDYLALLTEQAGEQGPEWQEFVNSLTTNLTFFFREPHHFEVLAQLARRRPEGLTVWCAAASTGEEPYSIAITLAEAYGSLTPPVRILASDIDTQVLARAEAGIYPLGKLEQVDRALLRRYFRRGAGSNEGRGRVCQELRQLVTFRQINLLGHRWPLHGPFDAIFCRNVMIYFDKPTQRRVLERFAPLMAPEGLLFAGHSESFQNASDLFRIRGKTVYEPARR